MTVRFLGQRDSNRAIDQMKSVCMATAAWSGLVQNQFGSGAPFGRQGPNGLGHMARIGGSMNPAGVVIIAFALTAARAWQVIQDE
ncbi:hypothetical protein, partial [Rhizobium leguminosarum]